MEHNINNIFQEKIKEAEQKPLRWKKDLVWEQLSSTLPASPKSYKKYYWIAASFTLVTTLGLFLLNRDSKLNTLRINQLAESISILEQAKNVVEFENEGIEDCAHEDNHTPKFKESLGAKKENSSKENYRATARVQLDSLTTDARTAFQDFVIEHEEINDPPLKDVSETQVKEHKIEAIIGIVPESSGVLISSTKPKKMRVRFFKSSEGKTFENHIKENQFIIARIK
jgi:hypothetical protein